MNERRTDFELLQDFVTHGDQAGFATVVRRHLDLVYATALRKLEDTGSAEEVTQNVFVVMARKAWRFSPEDSVPAWLYRATLLECKEWLRTELRRRRRERNAAELGTTMKTPDDQTAFHALLPLLDEAILSLREKDRTALLLRFYESQSLREVGACLGLSEDAAQKRVATALDSVVAFFRRRGFRSATAATATTALQQTAAAASAASANVVVSAILRSLPPASPGPVILLARIVGLGSAQKIAIVLTLGIVLLAPTLLFKHASSVLDVQPARESSAAAEPAAGLGRISNNRRPFRAVPSVQAAAEIPAPALRRPGREYTIQLSGIIRLPEFRAALLKVEHRSVPGAGAPRLYAKFTVFEGEEYEDRTVRNASLRLECLEIGESDWTLKLRENDQESFYHLDGGAGVRLPTGPGICLVNLDFSDAVQLFGELMNRTVLRHPGTNQRPISLAMPAVDRSEAAALLAAAFETRGLKIVLEGDTFALLLPSDRWKRAADIAASITVAEFATNSDALLQGNINLENVPLAQAARIYEELARQTMVPTKSLPPVLISFQSQTALTRRDALRALQILFAWNGIAVEPVSEKSFRLVPKRPR